MNEFNELIQFLRQELAISNESIDLVLKKHLPNATQLPIILHQYGLITIENFNFSDRYLGIYTQ